MLSHLLSLLISQKIWETLSVRLMRVSSLKRLYLRRRKLLCLSLVERRHRRRNLHLVEKMIKNPRRMPRCQRNKMDLKRTPLAPWSHSYFVLASLICHAMHSVMLPLFLLHLVYVRAPSSIFWSHG